MRIVRYGISGRWSSIYALALLALSATGGHARSASVPPLPSAEEILRRYEQFLGGTTALGKISTRETRTRRVEYSATPSDDSLVRQSKRPMLSIMYHESLDGTFLRYTNGCGVTGGWVAYPRQNDDGAPRSGQASTDGVCEQEQYFYEYLPLDLRRLLANIKELNVKKLTDIVPADSGSLGMLAGGRGQNLIPGGPRKAYLVLSVPARSADGYEWLYFDAKTGALLRRAEAGRGAAPTPAGENPRYTDFVRYRDVGDGTRAPFEFVTIGPNSQVFGVTTSITDNGPVDDSAFVRPKDVRRRDKGE